MPDSSTTPEPNPDEDPAPTGPVPPAPAGPSEQPSDDHPPLRPVDWDGHFSRTWNTRYADEATDRIAAGQAEEWNRQWLDRTMRDLADKAQDEADAREARAREERHSAALADRFDPGDSARSRLFEKTGHLDHPSDQPQARDADGDNPSRPE